MSDIGQGTGKHHQIRVNNQLANIKDGTPIGRQILLEFRLLPVDEYILLQHRPDGNLEEISPDEDVQLNHEGITPFYAFKADRVFYFTLNERRYPWTDKVQETFLRELGSIPEAEDIWLEREDREDEMIPRGGTATLTGNGTERFYSKAAPSWTLDIQGVEITLRNPQVTVRDAILKAGIDPNQGWIIVLRVQGQPKRQVDLDFVVDLRTPGIERLRLTPKEISNGEAPLTQRRDFRLLPKDEEFLDARGFKWETVQDAGRRWLIVRDYVLPVGFNNPCADVAIDIPPLYPRAELDMFYCSPLLALVSGRPIPQVQVTETVAGRPFQRWSRHWPPGAWDPNKDSVISQIGLVDASLEREVEL